MHPPRTRTLAVVLPPFPPSSIFLFYSFHLPVITFVFDFSLYTFPLL